MKKHYHLLVPVLALLTFACNSPKNESKEKPITATKSTEAPVKATTTSTAVPSEATKPTTKSSSGAKAARKITSKSSEDLSDIYKKLEKKAQVFTISANRDTTIIGLEGTRVNIKANSFIAEKTGKAATDSIQISITEYYKISDIILAKLSTSSGEDILETGGMVNIKASRYGENYELKPKQAIEIEFPYTDAKTGMQLYTGTWLTENQIDWALAPQSVVLNDIYDFAEEMPKFPGGQKALLKFLAKEVTYPDIAREKGIEGTVLIGFTVDSVGNILNPTVVNSPGTSLNEVSLNAVLKMPKWIPGKQNGIPVNVRYRLPIKFYINGTGYPSSELRDKDIQAMSPRNLNRYILSSLGLGWINCDRPLVFNKESMVNYPVDLNNGDLPVLNMVFHRYQSVQKGFFNNTKCVFRNMPKDEKVTLVASKYIDKQLYLAIKETRISDVLENNLVFERATVKSLKSAMRELDKL